MASIFKNLSQNKILSGVQGMAGLDVVSDSMKGFTKPQRILSSSRPGGVLARFMLISMTLLLIMFLIFGLIQLGTSESSNRQGKMVMLSLSFILGAAATFALPEVIKFVSPVMRLALD